MRSIALVAALLSLPADALAWCQTTTVPEQPDPTRCPPEGRPIAWSSGCVWFRFDPTLRPDPSEISPEALDRVIDASAAAWASVDCGDALVAGPSFRLLRLDDAPSEVGYSATGGNLNTVTFRETWGQDAYHPLDAAAVTIVTFAPRTATILDADTELNLRTPANPRGFVFAVDGDRLRADLQTIVTHELGHAIGLAHSGSRDAVMWFSAGRGEVRQAPTPDDAEGVCTMYPPAREATCLPAPAEGIVRGDGLRCASAHDARDRPHGLTATLALALALATRRRLSAPR